TDTVNTVVDYLNRTWTFGYAGGNLASITSPAPESIQITLQYDSFDDLTYIQLPSAQGQPRGYKLGYTDSQGRHAPFPVSLSTPAGSMAFDFYQDGALVNVFYLEMNQAMPTFHAQYNQNAGSNLVTFESPTENSPQTRIVYNATFNQGSGDPTQDFWIT